MRCSAGPFLLLASLCTGAAWAADQDQHRHTGADPKKVGIVKFENSCSPLVQERIGRAMALLHSFSLHMPSHIFTRLGLWKESIASNRNVVSTAQKHRVPGEELHGSDHLVFAHLQQGEDDAARRVIEESPALADVPKQATLYFASLYATASMPARYAVERRQGAEAAALSDPVGFPGRRYAWADAVTYFARALGAARTGKVEQARGDVAMLGKLQRTLVEHREDYWAGQVEVQRRGAEAWLAFAEGRHAKALELMHAAADLEDTMDKHPVTPGQIVQPATCSGRCCWSWIGRRMHLWSSRKC